MFESSLHLANFVNQSMEEKICQFFCQLVIVLTLLQFFSFSSSIQLFIQIGFLFVFVPNSPNISMSSLSHLNTTFVIFLFS